MCSKRLSSSHVVMNYDDTSFIIHDQLNYHDVISLFEQNMDMFVLLCWMFKHHMFIRKISL
jgi:hypothetical protein